ncbi:MAG: DinB family protein, partial [Nitrospinae bacterium]|nr:DinB family protein [Nitrospinota bacterium]
MNGAQMIAFTFEMSDGLVKRALKGLTDEDLMKRPSDQDNPIGWLMWHKTRVEDCAMAAVAGEEQVWISEKWHEKFDMAPEPKQIGFGDSLEQVMRLKFTKQDVIGYANAVRARTTLLLESLSAEDL